MESLPKEEQTNQEKNISNPQDKETPKVEIVKIKNQYSFKSTDR